MNLRALKALWKANIPPMVWLCPPLYVGPIVLGLDGGPPDWVAIGLFLATMVVVTATPEFANTYADRQEDRLYFPGNPVLTGELNAVTAKRALIMQNAVAGALIVALAAVTRNYPLTAAVALFWFLGLAYSLPPFRFKETPAAPLVYGLAYAMLPIAAWLVVEPSLSARNGFIIGFALVVFVFNFAYGITVKFRKTFHALKSGLIKVEPGGTVYSLRVVGLKQTVRTAMTLETVTSLGAFVLVPIFWHLEVFDSALSIALLAAALPTTALAVAARLRDPLGNGPRCVVFMTMAAVDIGLIMFGVALSSLLPWGIAVLVCLGYLALFVPLFAGIQTVGPRTVAAPWAEMEKWSEQ